MSLKISASPVRGTASESRGQTSCRPLLRTPDPLTSSLELDTPGPLESPQIIGISDFSSIGSLASPPPSLAAPSLELTWAWEESAPTTRDTDESNRAIDDPATEPLDDETELIKKKNENATTSITTETTPTTEEGLPQQPVFLLQLKDLDQLTGTTLAQEALAERTLPSESASNTPIMMDELHTPAILFDDDDDATSYFNVKKEARKHENSPDKEVLLELNLPVAETAPTAEFASLWETQVEDDASKKTLSLKEQIEAQALTAPTMMLSAALRPAVDPMACFDPLHVEGKTANKTVVKTEGPAAKRQRRILPKLDIPAAQAFQPTADAPASDGVIDTPAVVQAVAATEEQEESLDLGDGGFDLLEWVTNKELPVNDPDFLALIGDTGAATPGAGNSTSLDTIDVSAIAGPSTSTATAAAPPKGKKIATTKSRRRNAAPSATVVSGDHSYLSAAQQPRPSTSRAAAAAVVNTNDESSSNLSADDDVKEAKYRRMRDLNNLASKRCRQNRKRKFENLLGEEDALRTRNAELRMKCRHMEDLVAKLKRQFIEKVSNPAAKKREPLDLEEIMAQRLENIA